MISTDDDLHGQVHLVTGATAGIGRETARALARAGARVVVAGRDEGTAHRLWDMSARMTGPDQEERS